MAEETKEVKKEKKGFPWKWVGIIALVILIIILISTKAININPWFIMFAVVAGVVIYFIMMSKLGVKKSIYDAVAEIKLNQMKIPGGVFLDTSNDNFEAEYLGLNHFLITFKNPMMTFEYDNGIVGKVNRSLYSYRKDKDDSELSRSLLRDKQKQDFQKMKLEEYNLESETV